MSISSQILTDNKIYSGISPHMNLGYSGHFGTSPRFGMLNEAGQPTEVWQASQAYVSRNVIPIVIRVPRYINYLPDDIKKIMTRTYVAMFENLPQEITGLQSGLTVETDEHPVGGGGEFQEEITDVKRARSTISITYKEKAAKAISKFYDSLIRYSMMDPDTKTALIGNVINIEQLGGLYTPDFYSGIVLWVEPDITNTNVVDSWLSFNLFPKGNGERTGRRSLASAGESPDISIDFASITVSNEAVMSLAYAALTNMRATKYMPHLDSGAVAAALSSANVDSFVANMGNIEQVKATKDAEVAIQGPLRADGTF